MNTVQIQDEDGEWITIGIMDDGALVLNDPDAVQVGDVKTLGLAPVCVEIVVDLKVLQAAWRAAAESYVRAFTPIAAAMVKTLRATAQAARVADAYTLTPPPPGPRRNRPAWQSPYGPPTRHHR